MEVNIEIHPHVLFPHNTEPNYFPYFLGEITDLLLSQTGSDNITVEDGVVAYLVAVEVRAHQIADHSQPLRLQASFAALVAHTVHTEWGQGCLLVHLRVYKPNYYFNIKQTETCSG